MEGVHHSGYPDFLLLALPVEKTENVEDVDANPDEEVSYCCQHEKLLKQEVVDSKHQGQPHCQLIQQFILLGQFIISFLIDNFVSSVEHDEHSHTDQAFA